MGIHPRHHLDARPRDALFALFAGLSLYPSTGTSRSDQSLTCLTVRSAFDLVLECSGFQAGDEVLVSAITHPDMVRIIGLHGLVAVPVDVSEGALCPSVAQFEARSSPRTKAVLHAHLFGARTDLSALSHYCRRNGLMLVEDCAQSITSARDRGHGEATVSLFSFGFIKTATAFGGAIACVRDTDLRRRMHTQQQTWPVQIRREYALKALKALVAMALARPAIYARLIHNKRDPGKFTRTIPALEPHAFTRWLRRRPSGGLIRTINYRLRHFPASRMTARTDAGRSLLSHLPAGFTHPCPDAENTHWLFPVLCADPGARSRELNATGFDAAPTTSQIRALAGAPEANRMMERLIFLPAYPEMGGTELLRLQECLRSSAAGAVRTHMPASPVASTRRPRRRGGGIRRSGRKSVRSTQ